MERVYTRNGGAPTCGPPLPQRAFRSCSTTTGGPLTRWRLQRQQEYQGLLQASSELGPSQPAGWPRLLTARALPAVALRARIALTPPHDNLLAVSERTCSEGSPAWSQMTPGESAQGSAGTPRATIGGPGSPWELPSSAEATQTRGHGETTRRDHAEQEEDAAEQTEPTAARHQHLRSPSPQAAAALNAPGIQKDCGAGARREGRREQREELMVTPTPHASDEAPSPRHQAYPEDSAPLRTALDTLFRRDCHLPVAHDAHAHLRSSAEATTGEMGPADAGGQGNGPRDEGSRAVGALQEGANVELGANAQTSGGQAIADEMNGEGANDDDASSGHGIGFATPRDEANKATAANGPHCDDHRDGSPAFRRELPMSDGEANAPGAPQPLRRSARRTARAEAPAVTRTSPRAELARAAGPRSGGGSDQRTPAEQQVHSRQGVQEEADGERDRSPRCSRGPERRGNPSVSAQGALLPQEEPMTPISQAQQAAPVAATPWSGRGSTRGRGGGRGARGGQRTSQLASREDLFEIAMSWDSSTLTSTTHLPIVRRLPPQ
ncbi:unnamed protein product [Closterium sp. NIES-65]|nr:unnamed protein product [Closterium sp. NIES-65]